jgi:hypothetical protein
MAMVLVLWANVLAHPRGQKEPEKQTECFPASDAAPCYASLVVDARVRYWEDAKVNNVNDTEAGDLIPLKEGDSWKPVIELATGRIKDWPQSTTAAIHYKVCDDGDYWLANSYGKKMAKWNGDYVPDRFLTVGEESGYGDYIIFDVDADGMIRGWMPPEIDGEEWDILEHNVQALAPLGRG